MHSILLSLLLALQLTLTSLPTQPVSASPAPVVHPHKLWWGMIDPELASWFARIPDSTEDSACPVLWNWSWRSFWAALTSQPLVKEDIDAAHL